MKLVVNASFLMQDRWTGVHWFVYEQLVAMALSKPENTIIVLLVINKEMILRARQLKMPNNVEIKTVVLPGRLLGFLQGLWQGIGIFGLERIVGKFEAYLSAGEYFLPCKAKFRGLWVYDLSVYETYEQDKKNQDLERHRLETAKKRQANGWITISDLIAKKLKQKFLLDDEVVLRAYPGLSRAFKRTRPRGLSKMTDNYLLYVGSMHERKNIERIVGAFKLLKDNNKDLKLVMVGNGAEKYETKMNVEGITWIDYMSVQELVDWYAHAQLLLYPSLDEGFGIPVLEAIEKKTLPLVSKQSSMMEIVGEDYPLVVNPLHTEDIYKGIVRALGFTLKQKQGLLQRIAVKIEKFSYSESAEIIWKFLEKKCE